MMRGTGRVRAEDEYFLLAVNLGTGEFFVIRWRDEGGSDSAAGKKPALRVIFPSRSIYSRLHLNPTEAVGLLQQSHLMQLTKECDCAPMPVLVTNQSAAGRYNIQRGELMTPHLKV